MKHYLLQKTYKMLKMIARKTVIENGQNQEKTIKKPVDKNLNPPLTLPADKNEEGSVN